MGGGGGAALEKELHRRAINPFLQERRSHPPHLGQQTVGQEGHFAYSGQNVP